MEASRGESAVTGGATARTKAIHLHDFVEDSKFKREFDGVHQGLCGFLVYPFAAGYLTDDSDVESDTQDVEVDEEFLRVVHANPVSG